MRCDRKGVVLLLCYGSDSSKQRKSRSDCSFTSTDSRSRLGKNNPACRRVFKEAQVILSKSASALNRLGLN
jgi:hypothetical protein